jgi:vitamin K-dependent gamma-carboxylase
LEKSVHGSGKDSVPSAGRAGDVSAEWASAEGEASSRRRRPSFDALQRVTRLLRSFLEAGAQPVDAASIGVLRLGFGAVMVWELLRFFALERIDRYYVQPRLLFPYYGFGWLEPLPGAWMHGLFALLILLAALICLGLWYRVATVLFFVGYTYTFLLDQTNYQNHLYLFCLIALLLALTDAHRAFSLDARRGKLPSHVPRWQPALFAFQVAVVYSFAALNKLDAEWLSGAPMSIGLGEGQTAPWALSLVAHPIAGRLLAWSGLAIDLASVPLLLWPRTRLVMYGLLAVFHVVNSQLFNIGVFPWFMLVATTIFFSPSWPRTLLPFSLGREPAPGSSRSGEFGPLCRLFVLTYVALQLLLPLRRHLYPGNTAWTLDGQYFSWTMKLAARRGEARLFVTDSAGQVAEIPLEHFLTAKQIGKLAYTPDMILTFTHYALRHLRPGDRLRWHSRASLNGRPLQPFVEEDGSRLAQREVSLRPTDFVHPLEHALGSDPRALLSAAREGPRSSR